MVEHAAYEDGEIQEGTISNLTSTSFQSQSFMASPFLAALAAQQEQQKDSMGPPVALNLPWLSFLVPGDGCQWPNGPSYQRG